MGTACHLADELQIGDELLPRPTLRRARGCLRLLEGFEQHQRLSPQPLACLRCPIAPCAVEQAHLATRQPRRGGHSGQHLAVDLVGARQRHQVLDRRVRHDVALTHPLLDRVGQLSHQRQAPADPAHRAVEAARQMVLGQPEALLQLVEKPGLLEGRLAVAGLPQSADHQRLRLVQLQPRGEHRVLG